MAPRSSEKNAGAPTKAERQLQYLCARLEGKKPAASPRGDHTLNPGWELPQPQRKAAVLLLLLPGDDGLNLLFTKRTAHLKAHAGQVSFPGGRAEPMDVDCPATALRESREEIGLDPSRVQVIGRLDDYLTRSGFRVAPVVGYAQTRQVFRPDPQEVDVIFEAPLSFLLSPGRLAVHGMMHEGTMRHYYGCTWREHFIWGATAGMLRNLCEIAGGMPA